MSLPARWTLICAAVGGGLGVVAGVIVGLFAYPPTALFAGIEIGIPATLLGAVLGITAAGMATAGRRLGGRRPPPG